jgi:hypothetical protein
MRENSEFGNYKGVYSHQELPDFTTLPEKLLTPVASCTIGDQQTQSLLKKISAVCHCCKTNAKV